MLLQWLATKYEDVPWYDTRKMPILHSFINLNSYGERLVNDAVQFLEHDNNQYRANMRFGHLCQFAAHVLVAASVLPLFIVAPASAVAFLSIALLDVGISTVSWLLYGAGVAAGAGINALTA